MPATLIRITTLPDTPVPHGHETIHVPMTSEDRRRVRRKLTTSNNQQLALELPTGTVLLVGQVLYVDEVRAFVVSAAKEDVLVVTPRSLPEAAFVGHLIGNLHRDIDIQDDEVIALWNAPLEARLIKAGLEVTRALRPFSGKPAGEHSH